MRQLVPATLIAGFLTVTICVADDASEADHVALQGTWTAVSGAVSGQEVTDDALKVFKIVVKGDKMTFAGNESTFALDADHAPRVIAVTPLSGPRKGKTQRAIYSLERNTFRLCMRAEPKENAPPPEAFETKAGDGLVLVTFQRDAAPPDAR